MARPKASQGSPSSASSNSGPRRSSRTSGKASQSSTSSLGRRNTDDRPRDRQTSPDPHNRKKRKKSLSQMPPPPVPTANSSQNPSSLNCPPPATSSENPPPKTPESRPQHKKDNFMDTPARARSTQGESSQYQSTKVGQARSGLLKDHSRVQTVPLEELLKAIFPPKEELHVEELCTALRQREIITTDGRWKASLVPLSPKDEQGVEGKVFAFVEDLSKEILAAYDKLRSKYPELPERTTNVVVNGDKSPETNRQNHSKPDAGVRLGKKLCEKRENPLAWSWLTIVCAMEFKKNLDPVKMVDNYIKVLWSMHEMMRNDPRRRFVFGLTIENTTVRLWFHNRATLVASDSFDLHRDWQQMVHILVALGTADRKDLGYDDTMSLHDRKERENIFHIQVFDQGRDNEAQPMIFRTIQRITDYTADVLTGRATRVWKVRKVVDGEMVGEDLVLKDTWINDDLQEEHLVLNDIRGQLKAAEDPRLRHFLTCDTAGWVPATKNDPAVKDHTLETHRRRTTFHVSGSLKLAAPSPQAVGTGSQITGVSTGGLPAHPNASVHGEPSFQHPDRMTPLNEDQRIHYRIVFKEVGTPLRLLDTFDHMFFALQGALCGCGAMHEAQYIHRDVSANNILLVERDRSRVLCKCPGPSPDGASEGKELVAVIMDFEYTRNIGSPYGNHHVRTGTWHFMASEVQSQCWTIHDDEYKNIRRVVDVAPWRQHALHDLEALFWVAVWIIFKYLSPSVSPAQFESNAYRKLFPINHQERLLDPARIHNSMVNGLPEAYHTFSNQYNPWGLFIIRKFKEAFALAYPQMELSVFTASSPAVVTGSMEFLVGLRTIVNTEPKLQGKLEDLKTRQEKELVEEHEKVK